MAYKVIACDFDDTLFSSDYQISRANRNAIKECARRGILFLLVTGRTVTSIRPYYNDLELKTPLIVCGGAEIYDCEQQRIFQLPLPHKDTAAILRRARELGVHAHMYIGDNYCYMRDCEEVRNYAMRTGMKGLLIPDLDQRQDLTSPKLIAITDPDRLPSLIQQFKAEFPHLTILSSTPRYIEFFNGQASKGNALKFLLEKEGYSLSECIALGDHQVDMSMLKMAGLGVAPANALEQVKAVADLVTVDNDHDCVAKIIEAYAFCD